MRGLPVDIASSVPTPRTTRAPRRPSDRASETPRNREFVQGLQRGLSVIRAFGNAPSLTIAEVAARTGLTRAVARRYLLTLQELECVVSQGNRFSLTPRLLDFGFAYLSTLDIPDLARPFVERVVETLHESCSVAVLDSVDAVFVLRVQASRLMSMNIRVGSRLPAYAGSMGKVLLAYLPPEQLDAYFARVSFKRFTPKTICDETSLRATMAEVRAKGYAFADEEVEAGVRTVAAPLFNRTGQVVAAINISSHAWRVSMKELKKSYLPVLLDASGQISRALGYSGQAR